MKGRQTPLDASGHAASEDAMIKEMASQTKTNAEQTKARVKLHILGPPRTSAWAGLVAGLLKRSQEVGTHHSEVFSEHLEQLQTGGVLRRDCDEGNISRDRSSVASSSERQHHADGRNTQTLNSSSIVSVARLTRMAEVVRAEDDVVAVFLVHVGIDERSAGWRGDL